MKKSLVLIIAIMGITFMGGAIRTGRAQIISENRNRFEPAAGQWFVSPAGYDSNACNSPNAACATINAAIGKATAGDTILVGSGIYTHTSGYHIVLLDKSMSLSGGWNVDFTKQTGISIIDGEESWPCLKVNAGIEATITRFDIKNGYSFEAGGIINGGTTRIESSIIQNNFGGGIRNWEGADLTVIDTVIKANPEATMGGGISNYGTLTVIRSSIKGNSVSLWGGGIYSEGPRFILVNSTVSDNYSKDRGGGIYVWRDMEVGIYSSSIVKNISTNSTGGIYASTTVPLIQNSIIADNIQRSVPVTAPDCNGTFNSGGYNLIGNTTGCDFIPSTGDLLNVPALIIPIGSYYGLLPGSPAIDAGNPGGCLDEQGNPLLVDQRGSPRPLDGNNDGSLLCDMGSYEFDPAHPILQSYLPLADRACVKLYYDDFSDPRSGWPNIDTGDVLYEYNNGEYRILLRNAQWYAIVRTGVSAENYIVSVDVRNATGVNGEYGIAFGIEQDWSGLYSLEIDPYGGFGLYRYDPQGGGVLAEGYSTAIRQGTASNHLRIERSGASIKAYANDVLLADAYDSRFSGPRYLGLINLSNYEPNVDIRFDYFQVDPLECDGSSSIIGTPASWQADWVDHPLNFLETEMIGDK